LKRRLINYRQRMTNSKAIRRLVEIGLRARNDD